LCRNEKKRKEKKREDCLLSIIMMIKLSRVCSMNGEKKNAYRLLVGKPERKRPLGRPRHRWDSSKMDLGEIGSGGIDWNDLAMDRNQWRALAKALMNLRVL
jgi:hypothetical protein